MIFRFTINLQVMISIKFKKQYTLFYTLISKLWFTVLAMAYT